MAGCKPIDFRELNNNSDLAFYDRPVADGGTTPGCLGDDDVITAKRDVDVYTTGQPVGLKSETVARVVRNYEAEIEKKKAEIEKQKTAVEDRKKHLSELGKNYNLDLRNEVAIDTKSGRRSYDLYKDGALLATIEVNSGGFSVASEKDMDAKLTLAIEHKLDEIGQWPPLSIKYGEGAEAALNSSKRFKLRDGKLYDAQDTENPIDLGVTEGNRNKSILFIKKDESHLYYMAEEYNGKIAVSTLDLNKQSSAAAKDSKAHLAEIAKNYNLDSMTETVLDAKSGARSYDLYKDGRKLTTIEVQYGGLSIHPENDSKLTAAIEDKFEEIGQSLPLSTKYVVGGKSAVDAEAEIKAALSNKNFTLGADQLADPYHADPINLSGSAGHSTKVISFTIKDDSYLYFITEQYNGTIEAYKLDLNTGELE